MKRNPGFPDRETRRLPVLVFAFLLVRLLTWAFLLRPWGGFDEPQHQGYVETWRDRVAWPAFESVAIPETLIDEIHRWPPPIRRTPSRPALGLRTATAVGHAIPNYETQQSPLYYLLAGRALALLPRLSPTSELYLLRLANVALAFLVGTLAGRAARSLGFGSLSWLPVAVLAFVPGFGLAFARVNNDALCAVLMSVALAAAVGAPGTTARTLVAGSIAAGLAPWAKLFGWTCVPAIALAAWRRESFPGKRFLHLALALLPGLLLAYLTWRMNGQPFPILENLRPSRSASLSEVPWIRDAWAVAKELIWVSGASWLVFPNGAYVLPVATLVAGVSLTLRDRTVDRGRLMILTIPLALFVLALAYHSWLSTRAYGAGGTVGWYLWAAALPLSILVTWGLARSAAGRRVLPLVMLLFLILTVLGDLVLFFDVTDLLMVSSKLRVVGIRTAPAAEVFQAFFRSRPIGASLAALAIAPLSWLIGFAIVGRARASGSIAPS